MTSIPNPRRGEKIGWIGGWTGGLGWIALLALVFLFRGQVLIGLSGLLLFGLGMLAVLRLAPWRRPDTRYWRLLLLPYLVIFAGVAWTIVGFGAEEAQALRWWHAFWVAPLLGPFLTIGWRRWSDGDA